MQNVALPLAPEGTLLPMGFRTFAQLLRPELTTLPRLPVGRLHSMEAAQAYGAALPWLDDLVRLSEVYLQYGEFPAAVAAARQAQPVPGWFTGDLFAVLFRDAFASSRLSESQTTALVARLWAGMGSPVNADDSRFTGGRLAVTPRQDLISWLAHYGISPDDPALNQRD